MDLYGILGLEKTCSVKDIKKAYRKLCLKYHPDKNEGFRKEFDDIQKAYLVLGDELKREEYDTTGNIGDDISSGFNEITKELIEKDKLEYQGSLEEKDDILVNFIKFKGDVTKLFEVIIHLEFTKAEEGRVFDMCNGFIKDGEVAANEVPLFAEYVAKRDKKVAQMERRVQREKKAFAKAGKGNKKTGKGKKSADGLEGLAMMLSSNRKRHASAFSEIIDKYSKVGKQK